ncbi:MAG: ZIP family metal transporter [Bacilli bacterium]|nr:ZIP family metal transporter [Bacilli bacterium]
MISFLLTILAGFSTMIGTIPIFFKKQSKKLLITSLGFASGVMATISFTDLLPSSFSSLRESYVFFPAFLMVAICFCVGVIFSFSVDHFLPQEKMKYGKLYQVGLISCLAIIMHNIPEGIITYLTSSSDLRLGVALTLAIALHNIPEGISISVPIYYSTGSRKKALLYTFISGISEPFGAVLAFIFLAPFVNSFVMGILYAFIAGIMIHISIYELLPESCSYQQIKTTIFSFLFGCFFMFLGHFLF